MYEKRWLLCGRVSVTYFIFLETHKEILLSLLVLMLVMWANGQIQIVMTKVASYGSDGHPIHVMCDKIWKVWDVVTLPLRSLTTWLEV